ncbi:hypothetical protein BH23ACT4_BH23ACT4_11120 [soil metagenome]
MVHSGLVLFYVPFLVLSITFPNPAWFTILGSGVLAIGIYSTWQLRTTHSWLALAVAVGWAVAISALSLAICNTAGILITHTCMS